MVMEAAFGMTSLLQAHTCGLNRFEFRDGCLAAVECIKLAAGIGVVLLRPWGRTLMLLYLAGHTVFVVFNFYLVLRIPNVKADALGWALMVGAILICLGLVLLYWRGWRRVFEGGTPVASRKWVIVGVVCATIGIAGSLMENAGVEDAVVVRADLDARFLLETNAWPIYRARTDGNPSGLRVGRLVVREDEGRILIGAFPPRSRCVAVFEPAFGTLSIEGAKFGGEVVEAAPPLVGGRKLRGLSFKRADGAIRGDAAFATDQEGNLFIFVTSLTVRGKHYEGIYVSPRQQGLAQGVSR